MANPSEKRRFLRHPIGVPIRIQCDHRDDRLDCESMDLSLGGLAFHWLDEIDPGTMIHISIPIDSTLFKMTAHVCYCRKDDSTGLFKTGVAFSDPLSAFRAKLAEEFVRIDAYRKKMSRELGFQISEEIVARDWIAHYAEDFNRLFDNEDLPPTHTEKTD